MNGSEIR